MSNESLRNSFETNSIKSDDTPKFGGKEDNLIQPKQSQRKRDKKYHEKLEVKSQSEKLEMKKLKKNQNIKSTNKRSKKNSPLPPKNQQRGFLDELKTI